MVTAYSQETGRAGRDGKPATATLFYNNDDLGRQTVTDEMKKYCRSHECRRAYLTSHFGVEAEAVLPQHQCCDNCEGKCMCDDCMIMYTASIDIDAEPLEAEASDNTTQLIIEHALNQYFKAVNDELQSNHIIDATAITGLTPELSLEIAQNYNNLQGEDVFQIAFPYLDNNTTKIIVNIIHDICHII